MIINHAYRTDGRRRCDCIALLHFPFAIARSVIKVHFFFELQQFYLFKSLVKITKLNG